MNDSQELVKSAGENWVQTAVFILIGWLVLWGTWVTRKITAGLSRAEHERICLERNAATDKKLDEIKESVTDLRNLVIDVIRER